MSPPDRPELNTAAERVMVESWEENERLPLAIAGCRVYLDELDARQAEIDRLRAANQRLDARASTHTFLAGEAASILKQLDELASQWGDEAVFRRCRDRLRSAVEAAQQEESDDT